MTGALISSAWFFIPTFLILHLSTIHNSSSSITYTSRNTSNLYSLQKLAKLGVIMCLWFMYLHGLSTPAPQWGTSWWHRWWWPAGNRGRTWLGSQWTVWSWGSSYSSMSTPLSRSSRPAACREQWGKEGGMGKTLASHLGFSTPL